MSTPGQGRSAAEVRGDIERERQQLGSALEDLRRELRRATDVTSRLRAHLALGAGAAFATGFVLSGGPGAAVRLVAGRLRR
jgi:hypothetical protein